MTIPRLYLTARLFWRTLALFGIAATSMAFACGDITVGGGPTDNRPCYTGHNQEWTDRQLDVVRNEPRRCPYVVQASMNLLPYQFTITTPTNWTSGTMFMSIFDVNNARLTTDSRVLVIDPNNSAQRIAVFSGTYQAAIFRNGGGLPRDSAHFDGPGLAKGWLIIPGNNQFGTPSISGPLSVPVGQSATWISAPGRDTISYLYQWRQNGSNLTGATGAAYGASYTAPGTYSLSVVSTRSDYSADTTTVTVNAVFSASVSGPTAVRPSPCSYNYTVSKTGGVAPVTHTWLIDGSPVSGTSNSKSVSWTTSGPHTIAVNVADAVGNTTFANLNVNVSSSNPACQL